MVTAKGGSRESNDFYNNEQVSVDRPYYTSMLFFRMAAPGSWYRRTQMPDN